MADGFVNAIGAPAGDADAVRVTYSVPAGGGTVQRRGIDCTGYESVIVMAHPGNDADDYLVEAWFYDDNWISAATRGGAICVQGFGSIQRPFGVGAPEHHWLQVPVLGKYMIISVRPGGVSGVVPALPLSVTYLLSHRATDKVMGFGAGYLVDVQGGLANGSQYEPGIKRFTSQFSLAAAGAADDRAYVYPPCGMGLVRATLRLNHTVSRNVSCYAQSTLLDPGNLNFYNGQYSTATLYSTSFEFINPGMPLRFYLRNHDASQLNLALTHVWDDTV